MALNLQLAEAYVQITARQEQFKAALAEAQRETDRAVRSIQGRLDEVKRTGADLFRPLVASVLGAGGLVAAARSATRAFSEYEDAVISLANKLNKPAKEIKEITDAVDELSSRLPMTRERMLKIAEVGVTFGETSARGLARFIETVEKFSKTTNVAAEDGALALGRLARAFDIPLDQVDKLASAINGLSNQFPVDLNVMLTGMQRFAAAAKALDLPVEKVLALAGALSSTGAQAQRLLPAVAMLLDDIAIKASDMAAAVGMSMEEFTAGLKEDPIKFLARIAPLVEGNTEALKLFGDQGVKVLRELAASQDIYTRAVRVASEELRTGQALQEDYARVLASSSSQMTIFGNKLRTLYQEVGRQVAPAFNAALSGMTPFVDRLIVMVRNIGPVISQISEFGSALRDVFAALVGGRENLDAIMSTILKVAASVGAFVAAVATMNTAFSILGRLAAFAVANLSLVAGALQLLINPLVLIPAALVTLYTAWTKNWGGIREFTESIWEKLSAIFDDIKARSAALGEMLRAISDGAITVGKLVIDFASDAARSMWEFLQREWQSLQEKGIRIYAEEKFQSIIEFLQNLGKQPIVVSIVAALDQAFDWLASLVGKVWGTITVAVAWAGERVWEFLQQLAQSPLVVEVVTTLKDLASAALEKIVQWWEALKADPRRVLEVVVESAQKALDVVIAAGKLVVDFASDAARSAFEWLKENAATLRERGIALVISLAEGTQDLWEWLRQREIVVRLTATLDDALTWVREKAVALVVTIQGIPEWFAQMISQARQSPLVVSIEGKLDDALSWVRTAASGAVQTISVAVQGIPEWLAQLRESKIVIAVEDAASDVLEKVTALWQQLTQDPERVLRVSLEAGESLLDMLQSGAAAGVDALANAFSALSSRAREFAESIPWGNIWQTVREGAATAASAVGAVFANLDQLVQRGVDVEREVFSRWGAAITSALKGATEFLQSTDFVESFVQGFSHVAQKVATVFTGILKGAFVGAEFFATLAADLAKFIADNANKLAEVIVVWRQQLVQALQSQDVAQEIIRLGGAIANAIFEGLRAAGGLFNVFVQLVHTEVAGFVTLGTQIAQELWKGLSQYLSQQQLLPTLNLGFSIIPTDKTDVSQTQKAIQDAIVRAVTGAVAGAALKPLIEKAIPGSTWIERIAAIGIPVGFAINFVFGGHEGNWEDAVIISGLVAANIAPIIFKKVQELLAGQAGLVGMKLGGAAAIGVGIATGLIFNLRRAEAGEAAADFSEQVQRAITAGIPALLAGLLSLRFTGNAWIATISAGLVLQLVWEKLQAPESVPEEFRGILQGLQESTAEIIPAVTAAFSKLGEAVGALINLLREVKVFDLFAASIKIVGDALSGIAGLLQTVTGILTGDWKLAWEGAAKILESVLNILKTALETLGGIALKIWDIVAGLTGIKNIQQLEQPLPRTFVTDLFQQVQQELSKLQPEVRAKLTLDTSEIERLLGTAGIPGLRDYLQGLTTNLPRAFEGVAMTEDQRRAVENIVKTLSALSQILDAYTKDQKLTADEIQSLVGVLAKIEQHLAALPPELQKIVQENAAVAANWQNTVQSIEALVARAGIVRKQTGGIVPGIGRGDKVPALLEPGEYVVPRWMLERNPSLLAALEAARLHKRDILGFRRGGLVYFAAGGRVEDEPGEKLLDATQLGFSNAITAALQQAFRGISQVIRSFISSIYESLTAQFPDLAPAMEQLNKSFAELLKRIDELAQSPDRYAQQAQEALERTGRAKEALPVETARAGVAAAIDPFREFLAALRTRLEQAFDVATLRAVSQEIASWAEQMQDQPAKLFLLGEAMTEVYARAQELRRAFAALGLNVSALDEFLRESERAQGESIHAFQKHLEEILKLEPMEAAQQLKALASGIGDNVAQMDAWRAAFHELIQSIQTRIAFFEELGKPDMARAWKQTLSQVSALFAQEDPLATLKAQIASLDFSNALEAGKQLLDIIQQNMQLAMADLSVGQMLVDSKRRLFQHVESMIEVYRELGLPTQELEQTLEQLTLMFGGLTDALKPFREEIAKLRDLGPLEAVLRIREIARSIAAPERMQHGGRVPGVGIGDKVPALLEPGEFVVRREVAQKFLPELIQLNAQGYQQGGLVTTPTASWPLPGEEILDLMQMQALRRAGTSRAAMPERIGQPEMFQSGGLVGITSREIDAVLKLLQESTALSLPLTQETVAKALREGRFYAQEGFTGFGGVLEPAGIVHKGEYVIPAWMVRTMPEVVAWLESVRRRRGYAEGGSVAVPAGILRAEIAEQLSASAEAFTGAAKQLADVIQIQAATQAKQQGNNTEELLRLLAEEQRKIFASLRERIQVRHELGLEVPEDWLKQFKILSVMLERDLSPAAQELAKRLIDLDLQPSAEAMKTLSELGQAAGMDSEQLRLLADEARRLLEEQRDLAASLRELGLVQQAKEVEAALASMKLALLEGSGDVAEIIKLQLSQLDFSRPTEELAVAIREKIPQVLEAGGEAIGVVASAVSKLISEAEARVRDLQAIGAPKGMIRAAQDTLYAIKEMFADEATKAMLQLQRQLEGIGSEKTISEFLSAVDASTEKLMELLHTQGGNIEGLKSVRNAMESYRRQLEEIIALLPPYSEAHKQAQAALERYTLAVAQATGDAFSALQVALSKLGSQETISEFLAAVEADVRSLLELRSLNEDNIAWLKAINAKYREILATFEDVIRLLPEGSAQQKAAMELMQRVQEMWGEASQTATGVLEAFRAKLAQLTVEKFLGPETFASAMQQLQQYVQEAIESGNIGMLKAVYEHKRKLEATFQELIQIFEGLGLSTDELRQRFAEFAKAFAQEAQGALAALRAEIERLKTQPIGSTLFAPLEKKQLGGLVLGVGTGDKVPALLEPGEFVVRRRVAQKFLPELMQLNAVGYAKGGVVAGDVASTLDATNEVATQAIEAAQEAGEKVLDSVQTQGALSQDKLATLIKISDEQKALLEGVLAVLKEINERHAKLTDTAKSQLQAQEKQGREKDKDEEPQQKNVIADIIKRAQAHSEAIARRGAELIKDPQALIGALAEEFAAEAKRIPQLIQDALAEGGPQALAGIRELVQEFERQQREWLDTLEMLGISTSEFALKLQKINASLLFEGPKKALAELQVQFEEAIRGGVPGEEIIDQLKKLAVETFGDPNIRKDVIATIRSFSERIREEIESIKAILGVLPDQEEAKARIKALEKLLADMQDVFEGSAKSLAERVRQQLDTLLDFDVLSPTEALKVILDQLQIVASEAQQRGLAQTGAAFAEVAKAKDALIAHLEDTATALEKLGWNADDIRKQMLQVQARFAALPESVVKIVDSLDFGDPVKSAQMLLDAISQIPETNKLALDFVIAAREEMIASIEREIERRKALGLSTYFLEKELERVRAGFSALSPAMQRFANTLQSEVESFISGLFGPLAPVVKDFVFNTIGGALLNFAEDLTLPQQKVTVPEADTSQAIATFVEASNAFSDAIRAQAANIRAAGEELVRAHTASVPVALEQRPPVAKSANVIEPAKPAVQPPSPERGPVADAISSFVKGIQSVADTLDTFGISLASITQSFFGLLMQSKSYKRLMEELQPIIQALADTIGLILEPLVDIVRFFRELLGITKEVNEAFSMTSANVPTGFKAERLRYAAAIPDQPPLKYAQGGGPSGGIFKPILDFFNALTQIPVIGTLLKFAFWLGRLTLSLIILDKIIRAIPVIGTIYDELVKHIAKPIADWVWEKILKPGWDWFISSVLAPSWQWAMQNIAPAVADALAKANWGEIAITAGVVYLAGEIGRQLEQTGARMAEEAKARQDVTGTVIGRGVQGAGIGLKWGAILGAAIGFLAGGPGGALIGALIGAGGGAATGSVVGGTYGLIESLQGGGVITSPGVALVHAGELVLPAAKVQELSQVPALWQPSVLNKIKLGEAIGAGASGMVPAGRDIIVVNKLVIDDPDLNRRLREYIRQKNLTRRGVAVTHTLLD